MAIEIMVGGTSPGLKIGGTDLSDHVRQREVQMSSDDVDITAMGAVSKAHAPGLRDVKIIVELFQDHRELGTGAVDKVISPLVGVAAGATIQAFAHGVTASST